MRNRTRFLTSASVLVIMIGAIFFVGEPQPSSGQQAQPTIDLNGSWAYMDGALLNIAHDRRTGKVTAKFVKPYPCPSEYATIDNLFDGQLRGAELSGDWKSCNDKLLVDACGKLPTYQGDFTATVSSTEMSGKYRLPYFTWTGACQGLKESTTEDPYLPLSLTRSELKEKQPPAEETKPEKPDDPNPTPESPVPDSQVGSAAETGGLVEVTIRCPAQAFTVSINWKNHLAGSYRDTGGQGGTQNGQLDFEIASGSNVTEVPFYEIRRDGQTIDCFYRILGSRFVHARYKYKVKREIVSCLLHQYAYARDAVCKVKP